METSVPIYLLAGAAALLTVGYFVFPFVGPMLLVAILVAVALAWSVRLTTRAPDLVIVPLVLIEAVAASSIVGQQQAAIGAFVRYPLVMLFCAPIIPALWRSGIIFEGGFRDYSLYLVWGLVSVSYSLLPEISLGRVLSSALPFCAVAAIASRINSGADARRVLSIMLAACGIVVGVNLVLLVVFPSAVTWLPDPANGIDRFQGIFSQPNEVGALMLATVGSGLGCWPILRGRRRLLCAAAMAGAVAMAVIADSRSPLLAVAIGVACFGIWKYRAWGVLMIVLAACALVTVMVVRPGTVDYFNRGLGTFTGRNVAWDYALRSIRERPFTGYGYEVDGQIFQNSGFTGWDEVWNQGPYSSIHDGYLTRAVSLGIFGLLFWLYIILRPMFSSLRGANADPWELRSLVMLTLLPLLIFNLTESVPDCRSFDGILLALTWAMLERQRLYVSAVARQAQMVREFESPVLRAIQG